MKIRMSSWNSPMAHFIGGGNTIKVSSREEFDIINGLLKTIGIETRIDWNTIRKPNGYVCLEYQMGKGTTYYTNEKESIDWYGEEPFTMDDIFE